MSRSQTALRACLCAVGLTVAMAVSSASAASAATLYVNGGVSTSGDCLSTANPCKTINGAGSGTSDGTIVTGISGKPTVEIGASGPSTTTFSVTPLQTQLTALRISPDSFFAAPSGATISKTGTKRVYGTTISYRESQPTTTTFVIGTPAVCKKPPKAAALARCIPIKKTLGTFAYPSKAGVNKLHFSGRLKGKKLAKGSYTLEALQGSSASRELVTVGFKIKG